jgi:hypothetical protein
MDNGQIPAHVHPVLLKAFLTLETAPVDGRIAEKLL